MVMVVTSSLFEQSTFSLFFGGRLISLFEKHISINISVSNDFHNPPVFLFTITFEMFTKIRVVKYFTLVECCLHRPEGLCSDDPPPRHPAGAPGGW